MKRRERFAPTQELLAIAPKAFGMYFDVMQPAEPTLRDGVAIVDVRGPLMHHASSWWCDSYEGIVARVGAALEQAPKAVVLSIDSPGGIVSGCFEASREIRAMAAEAGVPLYAYVNGQACSAAYALACSASHIRVPDTSFVGSIGVIDAMVDATGMDQQLGLRFSIIASGARKADGHPHVPTSEDAIGAAQAHVDSLAELFFELVAEARGLSTDEVRALEAGVAHGAHAVQLRLADDVGSLESLIAAAAAGGTVMKPKAGKDYEDAVAKLREIAEGDNEEDAAKAKKMLAALEAEDETDDDEEEDPPVAEGGDDEDEGSEATAPAAAPSAVSAGTAAELAARLSALEHRTEKQERDAILAARPDLSPSLRKLLRSKPAAEVRAIVAGIPKPVIPKPAAAATVPVTRGAGSGDPSVSRLPATEKAALDRAMGLVETKPGVEERGNRLVLGAAIPLKSA